MGLETGFKLGKALSVGNRRQGHSGKRCDHFTVDGQTLCGPAMLVPATAKCGSNALNDYTRALQDGLRIVNRASGAPS